MPATHRHRRRHISPQPVQYGYAESSPPGFRAAMLLPRVPSRLSRSANAAAARRCVTAR